MSNTVDVNKFYVSNKLRALKTKFAHFILLHEVFCW